MLESKQHPRVKHWSLVMPGKPQFFLLSVLNLEHWQGAVGRSKVNFTQCSRPNLTPYPLRASGNNAGSYLSQI